MSSRSADRVRVRLARAGAAALSCIVTLLAAPASRADVLCVNTDGSGGCYTSVAEAVDDAGALDEVQIAPGTYVEPLMPVTYERKRVRGAGVGVTVIQGAFHRTFDVQGVGGRLDLSDVTIEGPADGVGVSVGYTGRLELARVEIRGATRGIGISGGGGTRTNIVDSTIHSNSDVGAMATDRFRMTRTTVHSNGSYGMWTFGSRVITVEDSTLSGNLDTAIYAYGGNVIIRNSTVVGSAALDGGALDIAPARRAILDGSIFTDDEGGTPGLPDIRISGRATSRGFNLVKDPYVGDAPSGKTALDLVGMDPLLEPLADNGGPTLTHALAPGSPALEAVLLKRGCRRPDQRGVVREPAPCDIGAFEAP